VVDLDVIDVANSNCGDVKIKSGRHAKGPWSGVIDYRTVK
jgi:hypothetical protein